MNEIITMIQAHSFFIVLLYAIILDTLLGVGRAVKEHKFNSCVGIDGAIRKVLMVTCVVVLMFIDAIVHMDLLFMVPEEYLQFIGISKLGICELFSLLFILYEIVSILKNMHLCGLPIPYKIKLCVEKFLNEFTEELPEGTAALTEQAKKGDEINV